jgi:hypothetical protein
MHMLFSAVKNSFSNSRHQQKRCSVTCDTLAIKNEWIYAIEKCAQLHDAPLAELPDASF